MRRFYAQLQSNLTPTTAVGGGSATFGRASTATVLAYDATDNLRVITCNVDEARFEGARRIGAGNWSRFFSTGALITPANGGDSRVCDASGPNGVLIELARTNRCLFSEDFTNAAWVKTNTSATGDTTVAPDGATTADTLAATGANGTTLQTFVAAAAFKTFSVWIRRLSGTGNIDITLDNGATWTTVAVTATWQRFSFHQNLANEICGIRIVTSGDSIAVWGAQVETDVEEVNATSYIPTAGASASRVQDVLSFPSAGNIGTSAGTLYCEARSLAVWTAHGAVAISAGAAADPSLMTLRYDSDTVILGGGVGAAAIVAFGSGTMRSAVRKLAVRWQGVNAQVSAGGTLSATINTSPYTGVGSTKINIGSQDGTATSAGSGTIRNVMVFDRWMPITAGGSIFLLRGSTMTASIYAPMYVGARAITPSDATENLCRAFTVNVDGDVKITDSLGSSVTITCFAGVIYPIATKLIWSTGTTATGITGLV